MKNNSRQSGNALMWLVLIIAGLWVLWYFTGGPERSARYGEGFYDPETGSTYGIGEQN